MKQKRYRPSAASMELIFPNPFLPPHVIGIVDANHEPGSMPLVETLVVEEANTENAVNWLRLGEFERALEAADRGIACGKHLVDGQEYWGYRFVRAEVLRMRGQIEEAAAYLYSLGLPNESDVPSRASWNMHLGYCLGLLGRYSESSQLLEQAGYTAWEADLPELRCAILLRKGMIHYVRNEYGPSDKTYRCALDICERLDDWYLISTALAGIGKNLMAQRHFTQALPWFEQSLAIADQAGARHSIARLWNELAVCHWGLGDSAKSLELLRDAERLTLELGAMHAYQVCLADIGNVYLQLGDCVTAMTYYERALRLAEQIKDPVSVKKWNHNLHLAFQKFREGLTKTADGI